jgi:hypothetical protein
VLDDLTAFARRVAAGFLVVLAIGITGGVVIGRYLFPVQPAREAPGTTVAQAETVHVAAQARTDTVLRTVTRLVERWRTDTAWRTDTVTVRDTLRVLVPAPTLATMDSTIRACQTLVVRVGEERTACDQAKAALRDSIRTLQPRFRDRFGVYVGYGGSASPGGTIAHGAQLGVGVRVWP